MLDEGAVVKGGNRYGCKGGGVGGGLQIQGIGLLSIVRRDRFRVIVCFHV